jgi:hypothetical protein
MKYLYYPEHDYEELFDLKKDPYEINNLVNNSAYFELLQEQRKLYSKLKKIAE